MMRVRFAAVVVAAWLCGVQVVSAQPISTETLKGEWIAKVDALASGTDAGMRGFRFWATLGSDGIGRSRYVSNGKAEADLMNLTVEGDGLTFTPKEGGTVSLKMAGPGVLAGTWRTPQGRTSPVRLQRSEPAKGFDKTYSGRGQDRRSQCVTVDMKVTIRDGILTGTFGYSYFSFSENFTMTGAAWPNGDVDFGAYRVDGVFVRYDRGKIENGRFRASIPFSQNCDPAEFDLR